MKLRRLIEYLRSRLRMVAAACLAVLGILVFLDAAVLDKSHAHTAAEHLPGFWSVFGLLGCALIILFSKAFGHAGIMRREDYYDE